MFQLHRSQFRGEFVKMSAFIYALVFFLRDQKAFNVKTRTLGPQRERGRCSRRWREQNLELRETGVGTSSVPPPPSLFSPLRHICNL